MIVPPHDFFILIIRPWIFDTIGIIAQDKLSVNFWYFKAFKVSFSYSQDPDDKNVRFKSIIWQIIRIRTLSKICRLAESANLKLNDPYLIF